MSLYCGVVYELLGLVSRSSQAELTMNLTSFKWINGVN